MNHIHKNTFVLALFLFLSLVLPGQAQDTRTVETKVADVLAILPAKSNDDAKRLYRELMQLDDEGLQILTSRVLPSGQPEGVAPRFAVALLTHYSTSREDKARIEQAYLNALENADDTEVKAYFIDNLKVVGSDASIDALTARIGEEGLTHQAVGALESIGTEGTKKALQSALETAKKPEAQARVIKALGELQYKPAVPVITGFVSSENAGIRKNALWALALIGHPDSFHVLLQQASQAKFGNDASEATHALAEYIHQLTLRGNTELAVKAAQQLLTETLEDGQQHFRLAALKALAKAAPDESTRTLIKEMNRFDPTYRKEVLKIASENASDGAALKMWMKAYKKSKDMKAETLAMLAQANRNEAFVTSTLIPAIESKDPAVRMVAARQISYSENEKFQPALVDYLLEATTPEEAGGAKRALLRMMDRDDTEVLALKFEEASPLAKTAIIDIFAERRAVDNFDLILKSTSSPDEGVRKAAFAALPYVSSPANTKELLDLLLSTDNPEEIDRIQMALQGTINESNGSMVNEAYAENKSRVLPLLPYVNSDDALSKVKAAFESGNERERAAAFEALTSWQGHEAARTLLSIRKDPDLRKFHEKAFQAFLSQVGKSSWPDDQKLLMYREAMELAKTEGEKTAVLRAAGGLRSFLALVFVSGYLDDKDLSRAASRSVMQIALPTADARPGLTGTFVRRTLQKILDKLEGQDSQYEVIDIQTYLANMPYTKGYESIFNGKDLSGWEGLVGNPISRSKMSEKELAKKQQEANEALKESWSVKDGAIYFSGHGSNLCTIRDYGDFEMLVDWKISRNGDSGIYLRGTPQVQIWDPTGDAENAKVGSGGLFNNKVHPSKPLQIADNPVGEWNTFHIKMVGERVTVHLNGVLVVDSVVMENYWDRSIPIFPKEAIELQAHGNELAFRNLYVKELGNEPYELTAAEKKEGFKLLFNGRDLENWVGNKTDYVVEDNAIAIYPTGKGHGNLYTEGEYSDFIFRFEFQLTPGANNGLGIHTSLKGDAAYSGKEIQILDNTAPVYANLEPYQYHGSVYGIIPAKRGYLKPVGEWNQQEVYVKGDHVRVTLNGTVILDGDLKKATRNGTMDKKKHPGLNVHKGHIAFLGHGTVVRFRNIRIKDLAATNP